MTLGQLSAEWFLVFLAILLMASFVVGQAMNAVMGRQGFGAFGNMVVLAIGFYVGLCAGEAMRIDLRAIEIRFGFAVATAFAVLFALTLLKRLFLRA
jgi:hypothetical protein